MKVALSLLALVLFVNTIQSEEIVVQNSTELNLPSPVDPKSLKENLDDEQITRKKKHTTTFCVEIRPSSPYQKPFQVCEPKSDYSQSQGYYPSDSSYEPSPADKHHASAPAYASKKDYNAAKPAAAYSAPASSAAAYSSPSKPSQAAAFNSKDHVAPAYQHSAYTPMTYRNAEGEPETVTDDDNVPRSAEDDRMRTAIAAAYPGVPVTYISPISKLKKALLAKKLAAHNGLVISCQPSLAGYAAPLPSYHDSYETYAPSYRSSTPGSAYEHPYGQAKQPSAYAGYSISKPAYPQQQQYKAPAKPYASFSAPQYQQESHLKVQYGAPAQVPSPAAYTSAPPHAAGYAPAQAPVGGYEAPKKFVPSPYSESAQFSHMEMAHHEQGQSGYGPSMHQQQAGYGEHQQQQPAYGEHHQQQPAYGEHQQQGFASHAPHMVESHAYQAKPQEFGYSGFGSGNEYSTPKIMKPAYSPLSGAAYSPPPTYRTSERISKDDKEKHTINKMSELSKERSNLQWDSDSDKKEIKKTAVDTGKVKETARMNVEDDDTSMQLGGGGGWSPFMRTADVPMDSAVIREDLDTVTDKIVTE